MRTNHLPHPAPTPSAAPQVLITDRDETVRGVVQRCLQRQGFTVRQVANLDEARALAAQSGSPIMLMDNLCISWLAQGPASHAN